MHVIILFIQYNYVSGVTVVYQKKSTVHAMFQISNSQNTNTQRWSFYPVMVTYIRNSLRMGISKIWDKYNPVLEARQSKAERNYPFLIQKEWYLSEI